MQIHNLHSASFDDVVAGGVGHVKDSPAARAMERAGKIRVLDRSATPPAPQATPEVVASLVSELDSAKHSLALMQSENESLRAECGKAQSEAAQARAAFAAVPADLAAASEELAAAHQLLDEKASKKK